MAAHKVRAVARAEDGREVVVYPETITSQVICIVPDVGENGESVVKEVRLDELLNDYADEINENTQIVTEHTAQLELAITKSYAVCNTPSDEEAKTVDISPFILEIGAEVTIKFANDSTAPAATLNVSSSGAKPIMYKDHSLSGEFLTGVQKFVYDGENWNLVGDPDTNTDTTYEIMTADEAITGSSITPRTVNALNLKQIVTDISTGIVTAELANSYDIYGLQTALNDLIFRLAMHGVIDGDGLDTVVTIDDESDIVLINGMYGDGKVYI